MNSEARAQLNHRLSEMSVDLKSLAFEYLKLGELTAKKQVLESKKFVGYYVALVLFGITLVALILFALGAYLFEQRGFSLFESIVAVAGVVFLLSCGIIFKLKKEIQEDDNS